MLLDSFPGTTDSDMLDAAVAKAKAATVRFPIELDVRTYSFDRPVTVFDGFRLVGANTASNPEQASKRSSATLVKTTLQGGAFLRMPAGAATVWNVQVSGIAWSGNGKHDWMEGGTPTILWCMNLRDLGFTGYRRVLGSDGGKLLINACLFDGAWDVCNCTQTSVWLGGSDNTLWPQGGLFDAGGGNGGDTPDGLPRPQILFDYLSKTTVGALYVTAEKQWVGLELRGSSLGGQHGVGVVVSGAKVEGRNDTHPNTAGLVSVKGGGLTLRDCWLGYSTQPMVTVTAGGCLNADGITLGRALSAPAVPVVLQLNGAGVVHVGNVTPTHNYGMVRPVVRGSAAWLNVDASVLAQNA